MTCSLRTDLRAVSLLRLSEAVGIRGRVFFGFHVEHFGRGFGQSKRLSICRVLFFPEQKKPQGSFVPTSRTTWGS